MYAIRSYYERVLDGYDSNSELFLKWKKIIISEINSLVITSYSIHYTKLYDDIIPHFCEQNSYQFL